MRPRKNRLQMSYIFLTRANVCSEDFITPLLKTHIIFKAES